MQQLSSQINNIVRRIFKQKHPLLPEIIINWSKIVGLKFSRRANPVNIYNTKENRQNLNVLVVDVENDSIRMEIYFQQEIIIERIAVYLGFKAIHKLKIRTGHTIT